jgi:hypothetical protein
MKSTNRALVSIIAGAILSSSIAPSESAPGDRPDLVPLTIELTQHGKYKLTWPSSNAGTNDLADWIYAVQFSRRLGEGWIDLAVIHQCSPATNDISFAGSMSGERMFFRVVKSKNN